MGKQHKALDLAELCDEWQRGGVLAGILPGNAAAELRRQHALNVQMREALEDMTINVNEAMRTGGWVPTPLQSSFWAASAYAIGALSDANKYLEQS